MGGCSVILIFLATTLTKILKWSGLAEKPGLLKQNLTQARIATDSVISIRLVQDLLIIILHFCGAPTCQQRFMTEKVKSRVFIFKLL